MTQALITIDEGIRGGAIASRRASTHRWVVTLLAVLGLALLIRVPAIVSEPIDFHSTRQLRGLVVTRGFENRLDAPSDRAVADATTAAADDLGWLEPPVLEAITASAWALVGEHVWIPRLLVTLGYLVGAAALWLLADRLVGRVAAWVALGFYAFTSYGLVAATSVQPDPLQTGAICVALLAGLLWVDNPTSRTRLLAMLAAAIAVLFKPSAGPLVIGGVLAMRLHRLGVRRALRDRDTWLYVAAAVALSAVYLVAATAAGLVPSENVSAYFIPSLLGHGWFWHDWLAQVSAVVGLPALAIAIVAFVRWSPTMLRWLGLGSLVAYGVYGVMVDYRIATHSYYSLPLVPIVALGLGAAAAALVERHPSFLRPLALAGVVVLVLGAVTFWRDEASVREGAPPVVRVLRTIGDVTGHHPVIDLSGDGGYAVAFYSKVRVAPWPNSADLELENLRREIPISASDRLASLRRSVNAEYFVVNVHGEVDRQPELRALLDQFQVVYRSGGVLVYRLP